MCHSVIWILSQSMHGNCQNYVAIFSIASLIGVSGGMNLR